MQVVLSNYLSNRARQLLHTRFSMSLMQLSFTMLDKTTRSEDFPADAVVKTVVERIAAHEKQSIRLKFKSCFLNNGEVLNAIEKMDTCCRMALR